MARLERLRAGLAHAFAVDGGGEPGPEDLELVRRVARFVVRRRMTVPALLVLESARPLSFLGSQVTAFFGPMLNLAFKERDIERFVRLMERRQSVDLLIDTLTDEENRHSG